MKEENNPQTDTEELKTEAEEAKKQEEAAKEEPKSEKKEDKQAKKGKSEKSKKQESKADELSSLQKQLDDLKESQLRVLAEYDNFRKRSAKEKETAFNDSKANVLKEFLPLMDNFDRALEADGDAEALKKGTQMLFDSFKNIFSKLGVEEFGEVGDTFDPNIHNAVMHIESDEHGENEIAAVFSKGYKLGDRIIREAIVQVAN